MIGHHLRRVARDRICARYPQRYWRRLERLEAGVPAIGEQIEVQSGLAGLIGTYYRTPADSLDAVARGCFDLLGARVDFGSIDAIDWRHRLARENDHHLWRMKLCQLEVLHSLLADGGARHLDTALALLLSFERAVGFDQPAPFKTIWAPYGASHRLLAVLSGFALAEERAALPPALRAQLTMLLRRDAAFVYDNIEHDLRNNHTERNLAALCLYGIAVGGLPFAMARRLDREVAAIIRDTILPDGMQIERSAMYQGLTVMSLRIFATATFLSEATRLLAASRAAAAGEAWRFMTHEDGDIALFNDSWTGEVPRADAILGSRVGEWKSGRLPDAGYARLAGAGLCGWLDAGAIGPAWNPGHGHADFLSVEIDAGGSRLLVDPGTSQYSSGPVRSFERSAQSHNGPHYRGCEPVEYVGCFKVGRLATATHLPIDVGIPAIAGELRTAAGRVRRLVADAGDAMLLVDDWSRSAVEGRIRMLVPASWSLELVEATLVRFADGDQVAWLRIVHGAIGATGQGQWCRRFMAAEAAHFVEIVPERHGIGQRSVLQFSSGEMPRDVDAPLVARCVGMLASHA